MALSDQREASVASAHSNSSSGNSINVTRPGFFTERCKLGDWLNQTMLYIEYKSIPAGHEQTVFASYRREAGQEIRPKLSTYLISKSDAEGIFSNIGTSMNAVRSIYALSNDRQVQWCQQSFSQAHTAEAV